MEYIDWQLDRCREGAAKTAIAWRDREYTYGELADLSLRLVEQFTQAGVVPGSSVAVAGDFSPAAIASLMALLRLKCILVPLSRESRDQHGQFHKIAEIDFRIEIDPDDQVQIAAQPYRQGHELLEKLRTAGEAGLVLFSSGSTGKPKAILHGLPMLLEKFKRPRHVYRTISFLLFDHIGGFNTLFYTLANLGCVVVPGDRSVSEVCRAIDTHKAELLPASPSFLNLLLLGEGHKDYDLSSLKLITYGSEVMPERTLEMIGQVFPNVVLQQTYGLSELGILRSKSASRNSLLVKVGGEDYQTKVVDGTLRILARCSMLGYLNAPSPFDAEGWFNTGDAVIQEGEYYRILGRQSEIINVGGQKVYPAEVEKVIAQMPGVVDVSVGGEAHLLLGQIVVARMQMQEPVPATELKRRVVEFCKGKLQSYMAPTKIQVVEGSLVNYRFKKVRNSA
jgi:acyl-CoA synthetase (AMP-forming)/AMP-acid ligase II